MKDQLSLVNERRATIFALGAILCWSSVAPAFKLGHKAMTVSQLLLQACVFSCIIFSVANTCLGSWRINKALVSQALLLGFLNPLIYYHILFAAYERLPAQLAQSINYTWAITLALISIPVLGQKLSRRAVVGMAISYSGVLLITLGINHSVELQWQWRGMGLAFLSTFVWATYWILNAKYEAPLLQLMTWSFLFATPFVALVCFFTSGFPVWDLTTLPFGVWVGTIEMGVAFLLWSAALRRTNHVARIGQLIFLAPFASLLLIERVLEEPVPVSSWIGLVIIVAGVMATNSAQKHAAA